MSLAFLKREPGLKIFCILLAISLWAYVKYSSTPQFAMASEAKINVPIVFENMSENLVALDAPEEVTLVIEGNPQTLSQVKPANFKAYINLKDKKAGIHHVPIKITAPPDVKISRTEPSSAHFSLDPLSRQIFAVKVKPEGTASSGFILSSITAQPESVTVSGARRLLTRVKEVRAVCDIDGADMDLVQRIGLDVIDENEKVVNELRVEPRYVRTSIKIRPEVKNKSIPISPDIIGNPAPGYVIDRIVLTPVSAIVRYHNEMESPPTLLKTEPVSIQGAAGNITKEIGLVVPSEVSLVEPKLVKIQLEISSKKTPQN
jgi:YbbR domain-containing protein